MVGGLGVRNQDVRPPLYRSRSHTIPSPASTAAAEPSTSRVVQRPGLGHGRSHSYISPDSKPRNSMNPPGTASDNKSPRNAENQQRHRHSLRHRHNHSDVPKYKSQFSRSHENEGFPHITAGIAAELTHSKRANLSRNPTSDLFNKANDLIRMTSISPYRGHAMAAGDIFSSGYQAAPYELRRRATSDPRTPGSIRLVKSPIEAALDNKEARRAALLGSVTDADIKKIASEKEVAEQELRERIEDLSRAGMTFTRRLDYTYYGLLEKLGNLVSTLRTFQALKKQSMEMMANFANDSDKLDETTKRKIQRFRGGFIDQDARIADLESRERAAKTKAEELGHRLDAARSRIEAWEQRQNTARAHRVRMWSGCLWTASALLVLVLAFVVWREWWFNGDAVLAGLDVPSHGNANASLRLDAHTRVQDNPLLSNLPADVRDVLQRIQDSRTMRPPLLAPLPPLRLQPLDTPHTTDRRLRLLEEL